MLFNLSGWDDSEGGDRSRVRGGEGCPLCFEGVLMNSEVLSNTADGAMMDVEFSCNTPDAVLLSIMVEGLESV